MIALDVDIQGAIGDLAVDVRFRTADEPLVIVGPNGAGKTTTLMMILGAMAPRRGRVALGDVPLFHRERGIDVPVERRQIAYLPQQLTLFPHLDVLQNVAYGIRAASRDARMQQAQVALRDMDALALASRRTSALSGGEAQRVALARALACRPAALLLDEPLASLDVTVRQDLRRFLSDRLRAWKLPTVLVTHDRADAEIVDGQMIVIESGSITQQGRLSELCERPATEFVKQFASR